VTVPRGMGHVARTVADMVREMVPRHRRTLSEEERIVGVHLRGNDALFNGLKSMIESRIGGRAHLPVPSDPLICKSMLERDNELRWLLSRLEAIHSSPVAEPVEDTREQPA